MAAKRPKIGSVKIIHEIAGGKELEFEFTNRISVFDKRIATEIPDKGETLCRTAAHWFREADLIGVKSHFIKLLSPNQMRVRKVKIIPDYSQLNESTRNYLVPLEWVARYYVAGSMNDRLKKGTVRPAELGLPPTGEVRYGAKLPRPYYETTTKLERIDRPVDKAEALRISGITEEEYQAIIGSIAKIDAELNAQVEARGLIHVDGKKEFAMDEEREIMLIDVFGTADEDRFWDLEEYKKGNPLELSKEFVRSYYRKIGYRDALYEAREKGTPEPDIPPLPPALVAEARKLYINLFERITGETF
ncbi:MAG: phosphoribosylaminoimidazolesuccinocarboxamide synthase [Vicinamibacteria bacterium]